jgi:hypothetical protein
MSVALRHIIVKITTRRIAHDHVCREVQPAAEKLRPTAA